MTDTIMYKGNMHTIRWLVTRVNSGTISNDEFDELDMLLTDMGIFGHTGQGWFNRPVK